MNLSSLTNYWHLGISFLGTLGTFTAAVQTNADLTGSGTPGWTYLVGLGLSALTTLLVAKKSDPRVQQFEAILAELEKAVEAANAAAPAPASTPVPAPTQVPTTHVFPGLPVIPVVNDAVTAGVDILSEINKVIATFKVTQK